MAALASMAAEEQRRHYAGVKSNDLIGASFEQYYNENMKVISPPDFSWHFTTTNLTIQAEEGALPADLLRRLVGMGREARRIEARWELKKGRIVFTEIIADGQPTHSHAMLSAYRTAPTVVRIGKQEYVFLAQP